MKPLLRTTVLAGLLLSAGAAFAAQPAAAQHATPASTDASSQQAASDTPTGTWTTVDDTTHKPKSIVQITNVDGEYRAKVLKILQSDEGPNPVCKDCDGERKNKPIEGMNIMWGVTKNDGMWDGGKILDPKNGKIYKVRLTMEDGGQKLNVRGYVGFALMGRTQTWERKSP